MPNRDIKLSRDFLQKNLELMMALQVTLVMTGDCAVRATPASTPTRMTANPKVRERFIITASSKAGGS